MSFDVTWAGGVWFIAGPEARERVAGDEHWLDAWLAAHGATRADLNFDGSKALEQRFVNDFGPVSR